MQLLKHNITKHLHNPNKIGNSQSTMTSLMRLLIYKRYYQLIIQSFACLMLILSTPSTGHSIPTVKIEYIGSNLKTGGKPSKDTIPKFDIFNKFDWNVKAVYSNHIVSTWQTTEPDTITFHRPDTIYYNTTFNVAPTQLNDVIAMHYISKGSFQIYLNGVNLVKTGVFNNTKHNKNISLSDNDYAYFTFRDTIENLSITYIPEPSDKSFDLSISFSQTSWAYKKQHEAIKEINKDFSKGFYYLAFGIIFLILFLFFTEKKENLYFALFCIFASLAYLWDNLNFHFLKQGQDMIWMVLAFEFLSIFFAKMLRNQEKSKIPLVVIIIVFLISFLPAIRYYPVTIGDRQIPVIPLVMEGILVCYAVISTIYFFIRGFGQKRWEARAIVYVFLISFLITFILPVIILIVMAINDPKSLTSFGDNMDYLTDIGMCILPMSAAIVLGRKNGLNQKQLIQQINSIENLSKENLAREQEKKLLLETQNTELERMVKERTSEVLQQKEIIEVKNKSITDNLTYAQRIQSAILPDIKLIYKTLEQSFILYLPKDIVSGDFYSFAEKNNRVLIIAGDCTGHGVSGAFMSMIGGSLLNQIINERKIESPDQILNHLNASVIETFRQTENDSNDGMDVSICSFDLNAMELQYAGANRPLWLIRNKELSIVRPDKFPIGGLQSAQDRQFTNHVLNLEKNDTIYIFTDGYADQFGGEHGKKMMTSKFKEMLISIQDLDMRSQETHLKNHFDNWKGQSEQVDDVLVIGIRV